MDTIPVAGAAKIWTAKPIAMKVSETPAMALSIAARGMTERNVPTKRTPTSSSRPRRRHARKRERAASHPRAGVSTSSSSAHSAGSASSGAGSV